MRLYLDTSVLVPLFIDQEAHTNRTETLLADAAIAVSDFAAAEFASAIARIVRIGALVADDAQTIFSNFDRWRTKIEPLLTSNADVQRAEAYLRRMIPGLRTPGALNLAIAEGAGLTVATFDAGMARAARVLGIPTVGVD